MRESKNNNRNNNINNIQYISNILNQNLNNNFIHRNNQKTPEEILKGNFSLKLVLKDLYKNDNIDIQSLDLLRTLGTKWYKCPNGHLYVVGECGRPMEESVCPECNKKIGGRDHIPADRNMAVDFNVDIRNINNRDRINNPLLNQDQEALNNMNQQHNINQQHHMDDDIRQLIENNPEMNNYFNNDN